MEIKGMRTATITEKGQIAIPKEARIRGFKEGSKVCLLVYPDRIEIRPLKDVSEMLYTALMSEQALAESWLSKEDEEAWKDL